MISDQDLEVALKKIGLEDSKEQYVEKALYEDNVQELLKLTELEFCTLGRSCSLVGTTLFLPSEWMNKGLDTYRTLWNTHANNVGKYVNKKQYHAVRIACNSYSTLLNELKVPENIALYRAFINWCDLTHFEARLLVSDFDTLVMGQNIKLKDFMIFNQRFVFGSVNRPDEEKIRCIAYYKKRMLNRYIKVSDTLFNNSVEIKDMDSLIRTMGAIESWDKK